ncbi:MAG: AAA family ATPase [Terricaulis sp.]
MSKITPRDPNSNELSAYTGASIPLIALKKIGATDKTGAKTGKQPLHNDWRNTDALSTDRAERWLSTGGNVGARLTDSILVIDFDPRNATAPDTLERFCKHYGIDQSRCRIVDTGGGGAHLYLRKPTGVRVTKGHADFPGIDLLSEGRYVVAAGSTHPETGRKYVMRSGPDITNTMEAPAPLLEAITVRAPAPRADDQAHFGDIQCDDLAGMLAELDPEDFGKGQQERWFALMGSAHFLSGGQAEDEWVEWCRSDPAYDSDANEEKVRSRWRSLSTSADHKALSRFALQRELEAIGKGSAIPRPKCGQLWGDIIVIEDEIAALRGAPGFIAPIEATEPAITDDRSDELKRLGVHTLASFGDRYRPPAPLLEGFIGLGTTTVISGPPGSCKTFAVIGLASAVAFGAQDFCGVPVLAHGPVLYVALEGQGVIQDRFRAYAQHHHLLINDRLHLLGEGVSLRPSEQDARKHLAEVIRAVRPLLVIIDTLSMAVAGADTDKEKDMAPAIQTANAIATQTGAAVIVIHHPPKAGGSAVRGSNVIVGNTDAVYRVEKDDSGISTMSAEKLRWAKEPTPLAFALRDVALHSADPAEGFDGKSSAAIVRADAPQKAKKAPRAAPIIAAQLLATVTPDDDGVMRLAFSDIRADWAKEIGTSESAAKVSFNKLPIGDKAAIEVQGLRIWREENVKLKAGRGAPGSVLCATIAPVAPLTEDDLRF